MTPDTEKLEALIAKATPLPWFAGRIDPSLDEDEHRSVSIGAYDLSDRPNKPHHYEDTIADVWENGNLGEGATENAALIVAAVNSLPALLAERKALREALGDIFEFFSNREQGPGHCHSVPGVWDNDVSNGDRAGHPCTWCAKWNRARAALNPTQGNVA